MLHKSLLPMFGLMFALTGPASAELTVVASIKPIHSLVAAVMKGTGEPVLLIDGHASPHTYALKPSDAAALQNADVIVRIGPDMEAFLNGALQSLGGKAAVINLSETPGLETLSFRPEGVFKIDGNQEEGHKKHDHDEHGHEEDEHAHEGHEEEHHDEESQHASQAEGEHEHHDHKHIRTTFDMHFWLDPDNAGHIVRRIADALIEANPANVDLYQANAVEMLNKLDLMSDDIEALLEPVHEKRFIVFHDAYHYFENRFDLHAAGSFSINPQTPPGAETLAELKEAAANGLAVCAFVEPQFSTKMVEVIAEGTNLRIGTLDPIGVDIKAGPGHYEQMMRAMAQSFRDCLGG